MQLPLWIPLQASRSLAWLLLAAHGGVAATLIALALLTEGKIVYWAWGLLPVIGGSLGWQWLRLFGRRRYVALHLRTDARLEYHRHDGSSGMVHIDRASTVMAGLLVLLLRPVAGGRSLSLVLLPDAFLTTEDFRHLRLWLRWHASESQAG